MRTVICHARQAAQNGIPSRRSTLIVNKALVVSKCGAHVFIWGRRIEQSFRQNHAVLGGKHDDFVSANDILSCFSRACQKKLGKCLPSQIGRMLK